MARVRFRSATAKTAASSTKENKTDRMSPPPSSSSTNGADTRRRTRATRSCTVEKRRNLRRSSTGFIEPLMRGLGRLFFHVHHNDQMIRTQRDEGLRPKFVYD